MQEYETRITDENGALSLLLTGIHVSDFAAIRAALHLCKVGDTTEVWRGEVCVYKDRVRSRPSLVWPVTAAEDFGHE